jgi:polyhydroxyalkanoate synthesis repressor PhaR
MKSNVAKPLIIKKYENRRLYNTLTSQYINQEQVAQLVRHGHDVRVIDAANGEDITRLIIAQIVLEDAKTPDSVFPLDVLRQMIVASGRATQDGALRYMRAMMDMYQNAYRAMPAPLNPFEVFSGWGQSVGNKNTAEATANPDLDASTTSPAGQSRKHENGSEVAELRHRIEELETALKARKIRKKTSATKSRRKS